jgi:hypothetical protein
MVGLLACLLFGAFKLSAQDEQVFKGQITPCVCTGQDAHAPAAANGVTSPLCTPACAEGGAKYLLSDFQHKVTYQFDNQDLPKSFASQYVFVIGILDRSSGTIHVHNVLPDLPPQIKRAKTVAVVCDACPRGMAKARRAAFEELTDWKRFTVAPDPKNADLIFLFSANRYRGDYVTRDGPDERPVHVDITYMNVVDPHTGVSLWGDSERLGSWFVGTATKDLISELREMMEEDVNPSERQSFIKRHHIPKAATDTGK